MKAVRLDGIELTSGRGPLFEPESPSGTSQADGEFNAIALPQRQ